MKKFFLSMMALVLSFFVLFGCSNDLDNSSLFLAQLIKAQSVSAQTASLVVSTNSEDSRSAYIADIKSVIVTVKGYGADGTKFEKSSGKVEISGGKGGSVTVSEIPLCSNAVVEVQAFSDSGAASKIDGIKISSITDIKSTGNSVTVTWDSSKKGCVYAALIDAGVNTNSLTSAQAASIAAAIPDVHASLINASALAAAFKAGSLGDASSYKMTAGSVKVTCNDYNGCTLQVSDPSSSTGTAVKGSDVTISDVAPGTWTLYVLDGTTVKASKSVTVTSGETASVTVGTIPHEGYRVHLLNADSWSSHSVYAYNDKNTGDSWPGNSMTKETNGYYIDLTQTWVSAGTTMVIFYGGNNNDRYPADQKPGVVIPADVTEAWYNLSTHSWSTVNPNEPVAPTVTISPADGSQIAINGSISVQFTNGNDTISSAKVTVNGTEYNMGTTAGTWSKTLSELGITSEGAKVTVSASVTNSAGTGTASAELKTKPASKLVTNPNELRIYQVMVASFQDGDPNIGYSQMWGPDGALKGGDLQGVINALDYIKSLGCNALWMTPIFNSATGDEKLRATGYFASDYFNIDPHFGTNEKFAELVEACHNKGIAVILDGVFGHNGGSVAASPNRNGILNPGITPDTSNPVNYASNGNSLKYYSDVARYWITEYKIDGWRFDQCYQVGLGDKDNDSGKFPINTGAGGHNYWYDIRKVIETAASSNGTKGTDWGTLGYMVGEHWHGDQNIIQMGSVNAGYTDSSYGDTSKAAAGYGLNSCFDFPAYYKVVQGFAQEWGGKTSGNITTGLSYLYQTYEQKGYKCIEDDGSNEIYYPNFMLSNHDLYRIGDLIKKKFSCGYDSDEYIGRNKVLLAAQCAYSGPITIYYGDEIGDHSVDLSGWGGDNVARSSGKITGFNTREQAIHDWTAKCLEARADHEALWNGTNSEVSGSCGSDFYVAQKVGGGETIYIAFNYNKSSSNSFSMNGASGTDLLSGDTFNGTVTVPALSARYILVK